MSAVLEHRRRLMGMGGLLFVSIAANNKYINSSGGISNSNDFYYTTTIAVNCGQLVSFSCYGGAVTSVISTFDGVYTSRVRGTGSSSYKTYTWTADTDCLVAFSAKRGTNNPMITIDGNNVEIIGY